MLYNYSRHLSLFFHLHCYHLHVTLQSLLKRPLVHCNGTVDWMSFVDVYTFIIRSGSFQFFIYTAFQRYFRFNIQCSEKVRVFFANFYIWGTPPLRTSDESFTFFDLYSKTKHPIELIWSSHKTLFQFLHLSTVQ